MNKPIPAIQKPILTQSPISKRWFIVTKYKWLDEEKGMFESLEKINITEQMHAELLNERERIYQDICDNLGYLASSDGNLREQALSLQEHYYKLAELKEGGE
jgi:hypothetical protein